MQLVQILLFAFCLVATSFSFVAAQQDPDIIEGTGDLIVQQPGLVSIRYRLKWDALWKEGATIEEVPQKERDEYIDEALMEISSKMKRKHKLRSLSKFNIRETLDNFVDVEYPELRSESDGRAMNDTELKDLALHLLSTGVVNKINVVRDGQDIDVFQLKDYQKKADANFAETKKHKTAEQSHHEMRVKKEREQKRQQNEAEIKEIMEKVKAENDAESAQEIEAIKEMEDNMKMLSGNLDLINSKINDLQKLQSQYKNLRKGYEEKHGIENGDDRLEKAMDEIRATLKQTEENKKTAEKEVREMMHAKERTDAAIKQVQAEQEEEEEEVVVQGVQTLEDALFEIPSTWVLVKDPIKPKQTEQDQTEPEQVDTGTSEEPESSITNDEL